MARDDKSRTYAKALQEIKKGSIEPAYFFYGEEIFLADNLSEAIVQKIFKSDKDDFNVHLFYGKESRSEDILNNAMSFPMLADRKVVILKDAEQLEKNGRDTLAKYFEHPLDTTVFIVISSKPDFRQNLFKKLKDSAVCVELKKLRDNEVPAWIESFAESKGKTIDARAAMLLASKVDMSLRELSTEVEKLATYVGTRPEINDEDVETVIGVSRQFNVFELCAAVGQKDFVKASGIMTNMIRHGEQPVGMIAMMYRQFMILWNICEMRENGRSTQEIEKVLMNQFRIYPNFFQNDYWPQAQKFSVAEIHKCMAFLLEADSEIKSSSVKDDTIMHQLLFKLTRAALI